MHIQEDLRSLFQVSLRASNKAHVVAWKAESRWTERSSKAYEGRSAL